MGACACAVLAGPDCTRDDSGAFFASRLRGDDVFYAMLQLHPFMQSNHREAFGTLIERHLHRLVTTATATTASVASHDYRDQLCGVDLQSIRTLLRQALCNQLLAPSSCSHFLRQALVACAQLRDPIINWTLVTHATQGAPVALLDIVRSLPASSTSAVAILRCHALLGEEQFECEIDRWVQRLASHASDIPFACPAFPRSLLPSVAPHVAVGSAVAVLRSLAEETETLSERELLFHVLIKHLAGHRHHVEHALPPYLIACTALMQAFGAAEQEALRQFSSGVIDVALRAMAPQDSTTTASQQLTERWIAAVLPCVVSFCRLGKADVETQVRVASILRDLLGSTAELRSQVALQLPEDKEVLRAFLTAAPSEPRVERLPNATPVSNVANVGAPNKPMRSKLSINVSSFQ
jgi:hypothetical protein